MEEVTGLGATHHHVEPLKPTETKINKVAFVGITLGLVGVAASFIFLRTHPSIFFSGEILPGTVFFVSFSNLFTEYETLPEASEEVRSKIPEDIGSFKMPSKDWEKNILAFDQFPCFVKGEKQDLGTISGAPKKVQKFLELFAQLGSKDPKCFERALMAIEVNLMAPFLMDSSFIGISGVQTQAYFLYLKDGQPIVEIQLLSQTYSGEKYVRRHIAVNCATGEVTKTVTKPQDQIPEFKTP